MNTHPPEAPNGDAAAIVSLLYRWFRPRSVIDFGCNVGYYVREFLERNVYAMGVDFEHLESHIVIPNHAFVAADLTQQSHPKIPSLGAWGFDLGLCFEVMEHVPEDLAGAVLDNVASRTNILAFSAAQPGQGGYRHVNEREPEHWESELAARGFRCSFDAGAALPDAVSWYMRRNLKVYLR